LSPPAAAAARRAALERYPVSGRWNRRRRCPV